MKSYEQLFIDGHWVAPARNGSFETVDPSTEQVIAKVAAATAEDIDLAVTLGLGYPRGPLALGDALGATTILTILRNMHSVLGEQRYRPSPWLARRAQLGLSLTQRDAADIPTQTQETQS